MRVQFDAMRFRTRVLLLWLVPVAALMSVSFWMIQRMVQVTVRDGLRQSLRLNHEALSAMRTRLEARESRFLRIAGENSALKATLQLALQEGNSPAARATLEDQLKDLCERMGFDLLLAARDDRTLLAGIVRLNGKFVPLREIHALTRNGLFALGSEIYNTASVPMEISGETVASLVVGDLFELSPGASPMVLLRDGKVLRSSVPGATPVAVEWALRRCSGLVECDVRINGVGYVSLPFRSGSVGSGDSGFRLLTMQDVNAALAPVQSGLRWVFLSVFAMAAGLALICGVLSSRSIVRPISALAAHLKAAGHVGRLGEVDLRESSGITEIDDLTRSFNDAAAATSSAREKLEAAYVQFVGSLAKALDARDKYTAGHSLRVSELACRIGAGLGMSGSGVERVRMGALLHDIGKIGISDTVLLKAGRLSDAETAIIRQHPEIGRRILEKVQGFSEWLDAVELHHENWDGTGYPHGLKGECVPIEARIIHVADAYDAMTSDRPYRKGMGHERAVLTLRARAGSDFDPAIVACLIALPGMEVPRISVPEGLESRMLTVS